MAKNSPSIASYAKEGFGFAIGTIGAFIIAMLVAAVFFVPGFVLVTRAHKNEKERLANGSPNTSGATSGATTIKVIGYVLMAIGMIIGLGFGANAFFGLLGEDI